MAKAIIRPNADTATAEWDSSSPHYAQINDPITDPTAGGDEDWISEDDGGESDTDIYDMQSIRYVKLATAFTLHIRGNVSEDWTGQDPTQPTAQLKIGATWYNFPAINFTVRSYDSTTVEWKSVTITQNCTQAELDALQLKLIAPDTFPNFLGSGSSKCRITVAYLEVTYTSSIKINEVPFSDIKKLNGVTVEQVINKVNGIT